MLETASGYELNVEPEAGFAPGPRGPGGCVHRRYVRVGRAGLGLLKQHFTYRLVLELDEAGMLTGHLVGQLAELYERIERHDGLMRLCGLSPENRDVLHALAGWKTDSVYHDREEAVMGRCHPLPR